MKEKVNVTAGKFTSEIIWGYILYGIIVYILTEVVNGLVQQLLMSSSDWLLLIISAAISIVGAIVTWKLAIKFTLKKKTTSRDNIPSIVKNLIIFFVALTIIGAVIDVISLNNKISQATEQFNIRYNNSELKEYYLEQFEAEVATVRTQGHTMLIVSCIASLIVHIVMIRYLKYKLEYEL